MEAQSRQSRIPKFGFGFKKLLNGDKSKDPPPSSGSNLSSPSVTRSKSMRVPRTQVPAIVKRDHSNSIDNGDDPTPLVMSAREQLPPPPPPSLLRPRAKTLSSRSHPNSRCNSPHNDPSPPSGGGAGITSSTGFVNEAPLVVSVGEVGPHYYKGRHTRSHSIGSKEKQLINNRPPSASSMNRRTISKGPSTGVPTSSVQGKGRVVPSSSRLVSEGSGRMKVNRTNSNTDQPDGSNGGGSRGTVVSDKNTLGTGSGGRGKRPFSFHEGSPDLNQLASEISLEDETTTGAATGRTHREPVKRPTGGQGNY